SSRRGSLTARPLREQPFGSAGFRTRICHDKSTTIISGPGACRNFGHCPCIYLAPHMPRTPICFRFTTVLVRLRWLVIDPLFYPPGRPPHKKDTIPRPLFWHPLAIYGRIHPPNETRFPFPSVQGQRRTDAVSYPTCRPCGRKGTYPAWIPELRDATHRHPANHRYSIGPFSPHTCHFPPSSADLQSSSQMLLVQTRSSSKSPTGQKKSFLNTMYICIRHGLETRRGLSSQCK
ncbi:hypothetical protein RSAG8_07441, partial [Rhizoctonia solani AG-8 WAC10335]